MITSIFFLHKKSFSALHKKNMSETHISTLTLHYPSAHEVVADIVNPDGSWTTLRVSDAPGEATLFSICTSRPRTPRTVQGALGPRGEWREGQWTSSRREYTLFCMARALVPLLHGRDVLYFPTHPGDWVAAAVRAARELYTLEK